MDKKVTILDVIYDPEEDYYKVYKKAEPTLAEIHNYIQIVMPSHLHSYMTRLMRDIGDELKKFPKLTIDEVLRSTCDSLVRFAQNTRTQPFRKSSVNEYFKRAHEMIQLIKWMGENSSYTVARSTHDPRKTTLKKKKRSRTVL